VEDQQVLNHGMYAEMRKNIFLKEYQNLLQQQATYIIDGGDAFWHPWVKSQQDTYKAFWPRSGYKIEYQVVDYKDDTVFLLTENIRKKSNLGWSYCKVLKEYRTVMVVENR
jgi:hypothetical protein